jgi:opacity protein-like surface antigen
MKKVLFIFLVLFTSKAHTQINDASKSFFKGPYVGGSIGYTKFNNRFNDPESRGITTWYLWDQNRNGFNLLDLKKKVITGTINAGNNWIFNKNYLLGVEAEISSGHNQKWNSPVKGNANDTTHLQENINYIANFRLKAGAIYEDKSLFYLTLGPTIADAKYRAFYSNDNGNTDNWRISINKKVYGFNYGVGVERQIEDKGSMKLEYILTNLDSASKPYPNLAGSGCFYTDCRGPSWKTKISSIRIGYNYHF